MSLPGDYLERVYAGVLGKMIGVYLGRPFEGWTYERIMAELGEITKADGREVRIGLQLAQALQSSSLTGVALSSTSSSTPLGQVSTQIPQPEHSSSLMMGRGIVLDLLAQVRQGRNRTYHTRLRAGCKGSIGDASATVPVLLGAGGNRLFVRRSGDPSGCLNARTQKT